MPAGWAVLAWSLVYTTSTSRIRSTTRNRRRTCRSYMQNESTFIQSSRGCSWLTTSHWSSSRPRHITTKMFSPFACRQKGDSIWLIASVRICYCKIFMAFVCRRRLMILGWSETSDLLKEKRNSQNPNSENQDLQNQNPQNQKSNPFALPV